MTSNEFNFDALISREGSACEKWDGRLKQFGRADAVPLWVADMDFASPPSVTRALIERASHPVYGYTLQDDTLFSAIINWFARRHHWQIQRDWLLITPGVVTSLHAAALALVPEAGGIIIQPPVYFPFFSSVTKTSRKLLQNPLVLQQGRYEINFAQLEDLAKEAKMLVLCSPHNPVGRVWTKAELHQLLCIAKKHNLLIFSDDIHADLIMPGYRHHMLAALATDPDFADFADFIHDNVVTAVAPSKTFNIPGLGLSSIITANPELRRKLSDTLDLLHVGNFNPFSLSACTAAYREGEAWLESLLQYLHASKMAVQEYIATHLPEIRLTETEGTYLLWLNCQAMGLSDKVLQRFFLDDCKLAFSPGYIFGKGGEGFVRMNIGTPLARILTALDTIKSALPKLKNN